MKKNLSYKLTRRNLLWGAGTLVTALGLEPLRRKMGVFDMSENKMPVLFVGHGNPMNAIQDNAFTQRLAGLGQEIQRPKAILCISAHWLSAGTWVTRMDQPKTIHDFYGFPDELFAVQYPAPGSRALAEQIQALSSRPKIQGDDSAWGLDHGTWAILRKMYPDADIPVVQLSIDMSEPPEFHMELGKTLSKLREQGVLIVGSGNIVHNLRKADWSKSLQGFDWAIEFDEWTKQQLLKGDYASLAQDYRKTLAGQLSVPTPDHYYPLLYTLGAADSKDQVQFEFEGYDMGSISMRCFTLGKRA
jgi:4,5-DOPA dioxygenase extradiol